MKVRWILLVLVFALFTSMAAFFACSNSSSGDDDSGTDDTSADDAADDTSTDDTSGDDVADDVADDDTATPPTMPSNHDTTWNCMICHQTAFKGAPAEPHGDTYTAPTDCVTCHTVGDWVNSPSGQNAMNVGQNCLTCHSGHHGKTWDTKDECMVCHQ